MSGTDGFCRRCGHYGCLCDERPLNGLSFVDEYTGRVGGSMLDPSPEMDPRAKEPGEPDPQGCRGFAFAFLLSLPFLLALAGIAVKASQPPAKEFDPYRGRMVRGPR